MNTERTSDNEIDPVSLLKCYVEWGVDETISEEPINWFSEAEKTQQIQSETKNTSSNTLINKKPTAAPALASHQDTVIEATKIAAKCSTLDELKSAILEFEGCSLKKTASNTVFCDGNIDSDIMVIGEAPGDKEDLAGKPFIGEPGQLLDKMFAAIDMSREKDIYITNLMPWRPPGNRKLTDAECEICLPFLKRHIELFNPKMIILVGGTSAKALLNTTDGITKIHGKLQKYAVSDQTIPIVPIFHPAYLIRQPQFKKQTWHDLLDIKSKISELKNA